MKLTENIYQLSGVPYGTNSNSYLIDAGEQLILIDTGYSVLQWNVMKKNIQFWGLEHKPITHAFITHSHFDHAGNCYLAKQEGMKLFAGNSDAQGIEKGDRRTIDYMFNKQFIPCVVDHVLQDGEIFTIGNKCVQAIAVPGHSAGSYMFKTQDQGQECLFMGDFIAIDPLAPEDDVQVLLAWTGGPDYNREDYLASLKKVSTFERMILFPGHYYPFYGDSQRIFKIAYEKGQKEI